MELPIATAAKWNCELIADFHAQSPRLCKVQMLRLGWLASSRVFMARAGAFHR